ncbi:MAG: excinuclease ABC subunit UvrA, partial [Deltaproteobacteria bacterium]|nr:excinuclease ABC subunit UvrA [Deltaproteobacteria bacterium]
RELCADALEGEGKAEPRLMVLAPLYRPGSRHPAMLDTPGHLSGVAESLLAEGFTRLRIQGEVVELSEGVPPTGTKPVKKVRSKKEEPEIDLVLDRLKLTPGARKRVAEALETAFEKGHGLARLHWPDGEQPDRLVSERPGCVACDFYQDEPLSPRMFSFNSHVGACPACSGLGKAAQVDPALLVPFGDKPLLDGALEPGAVGRHLSRKNSRSWRAVTAFAKREGIDLRLPFHRLSPDHRRMLLFGDGQPLRYAKRVFGRTRQVSAEVFAGLGGLVDELYRGEDSARWAEAVGPLLADTPCRECGGERLKPEYRAVTLDGMSIHGFGELTVGQALERINGMVLGETDSVVAQQPLREIKARLGFLQDVGLAYLTLNREAATLSGGESQRIRLAGQIGAYLVGVLYVLDEPTIGLHPKDTARLLGTLRTLRDLGNTVVVVEHDPETILAADHVVDMGPGAGHLGGEIVAQGTPRQLMDHPASLTGAYLSGRKSIPIPPAPRPGRGGPGLMVEGATAHNLKNLTVEFPLGKFVAVTGVSGCGKSSLVVETLQKGLQQRLGGARVVPGPHQGLRGAEGVGQVVVIDQSPIGRSPKSNPATYVGAMDPLRRLMAQLPESMTRGYKPGRFSFNVKGGRCEACEGRGQNHIEMHFLADVWVDCEACGGARFNRQTLEVRFKGKNIADILGLEVEQAAELFVNQPVVRKKLATLHQVGLGYLKLGQPSNTLSGGEAQRVKLAAELSRPSNGDTVYILDEPTTGLHLDDTARLLELLHRLADQGNTIIVIEHNLDVIKTADWVIDLGPEGGDGGGRLVAQGTPAQVALHPQSHTGAALAPLFQ